MNRSSFQKVAQGFLVTGFLLWEGCAFGPARKDWKTEVEPVSSSQVYDSTESLEHSLSRPIEQRPPRPITYADLLGDDQYIPETEDQSKHHSQFVTQNQNQETTEQETTESVENSNLVQKSKAQSKLQLAGRSWLNEKREDSETFQEASGWTPSPMVTETVETDPNQKTSLTQSEIEDSQRNRFALTSRSGEWNSLDEKTSRFKVQREENSSETEKLPSEAETLLQQIEKQLAQTEKMLASSSANKQLGIKSDLKDSGKHPLEDLHPSTKDAKTVTHAESTGENRMISENPEELIESAGAHLNDNQSGSGKRNEKPTGDRLTDPDSTFLKNIQSKALRSSEIETASNRFRRTNQQSTSTAERSSSSLSNQQERVTDSREISDSNVPLLRFDEESINESVPVTTPFTPPQSHESTIEKQSAHSQVIPSSQSHRSNSELKTEAKNETSQEPLAAKPESTTPSSSRRISAAIQNSPLMLLAQQTVLPVDLDRLFSQDLAERSLGPFGTKSNSRSAVKEPPFANSDVSSRKSEADLSVPIQPPEPEFDTAPDVMFDVEKKKFTPPTSASEFPNPPTQPMRKESDTTNGSKNPFLCFDQNDSREGTSSHPNSFPSPKSSIESKRNTAESKHNTREQRRNMLPKALTESHKFPQKANQTVPPTFPRRDLAIRFVNSTSISLPVPVRVSGETVGDSADTNQHQNLAVDFISFPISKQEEPAISHKWLTSEPKIESLSNEQYRAELPRSSCRTFSIDSHLIIDNRRVPSQIETPNQFATPLDWQLRQQNHVDSTPSSKAIPHLRMEGKSTEVAGSLESPLQTQQAPEPLIVLPTGDLSHDTLPQSSVDVQNVRSVNATRRTKAFPFDSHTPQRVSSTPQSISLMEISEERFDIPNSHALEQPRLLSHKTSPTPNLLRSVSATEELQHKLGYQLQQPEAKVKRKFPPLPSYVPIAKERDLPMLQAVPQEKPLPQQHVTNERFPPIEMEIPSSADVEVKPVLVLDSPKQSAPREEATKKSAAPSTPVKTAYLEPSLELQRPVGFTSEAPDDLEVPLFPEELGTQLPPAELPPTRSELDNKLSDVFKPRTRQPELKPTQAERATVQTLDEVAWDPDVQQQKPQTAQPLKRIQDLTWTDYPPLVLFSMISFVVIMCVWLFWRFRYRRGLRPRR